MQVFVLVLLLTVAGLLFAVHHVWSEANRNRRIVISLLRTKMQEISEWAEREREARHFGVIVMRRSTELAIQRFYEDLCDAELTVDEWERIFTHSSHVDFRFFREAFESLEHRVLLGEANDFDSARYRRIADQPWFRSLNAFLREHEDEEGGLPAA